MAACQKTLVAYIVEIRGDIPFDKKKFIKGVYKQESHAYNSSSLLLTKQRVAPSRCNGKARSLKIGQPIGVGACWVVR
jgi:hypothetical protein